MRNSVMFALVAICVTAAGSCSDTKQESPKGSGDNSNAVAADTGTKAYTARAPLEQARTLAKEWQPDAVLTRIHTVVEADEDGTASGFGWAYEFYSPKEEAWRKVAAHPQTGVTGRRTPSGKRHPIAGNFIDSSDAIKEAKKNGFTATTDIHMELRVITTESQLKPGSYWCIGTSDDLSMNGLKGYCVDATTGKFTARIGH